MHLDPLDAALRQDRRRATRAFAPVAGQSEDGVPDDRESRGVRVWSVVIGRDDLRSVAPFSDWAEALTDTEAVQWRF